MTNTQNGTGIKAGAIIRVPKGTAFAGPNDTYEKRERKTRKDQVVVVEYAFEDGTVGFSKGSSSGWYFVDKTVVELLVNEPHEVTYNTHVAGGGWGGWDRVYRTKARCTCGARWPESRHTDNLKREDCEDYYRDHLARVAGVDSQEVRI